MLAYMIIERDIYLIIDLFLYSQQNANQSEIRYYSYYTINVLLRGVSISRKNSLCKYSISHVGKRWTLWAHE